MVFGAASEAFSQRNINCSIAESVERFRPVVAAAHAAGIKVRAAISCASAVPTRARSAPDEVERVVRLMKDIGVDHCGVADTIGVGTPRRVQAALERALKHYPLAEVSGHFHDTYGQALANILACLELGIHTFDTSIAGLGGCPYAKGATGNVASEDVVFMLRGMGIDTGIDLDALVDAGGWISGVLGPRRRCRAPARRCWASARRRPRGAVTTSSPKVSSASARALAEHGHPHAPRWLPEAVRTSQQAADALGVAVGQIAKSVIFRRQQRRRGGAGGDLGRPPRRREARGRDHRRAGPRRRRFREGAHRLFHRRRGAAGARHAAGDADRPRAVPLRRDLGRRRPPQRRVPAVARRTRAPDCGAPVADVVVRT